MAMLGIGNYLCEACKNFDTDGADGNHPSCSKQPFSVHGQTAIPLGKECPFGYEFGIPSGYPVSMPRNEKRAYEIKALLDKARDAAEIDDLKDCPFCGGGAEESTIFDFLTSVPHALLGDDPIALEVRVSDCAAYKIDRSLEAFYQAMEEAYGLHMRYKTTDDEYRDLKDELISECRHSIINTVVNAAQPGIEVEKDRLIADLIQLVLDMHAHPCKGFVNCPSNGCQWWSAERKKCQIGERMRDLGIAEFGVPWKAKR